MSAPLICIFWTITLTWSLFAAIFAFSIHSVVVKDRLIRYQDLSLPARIQQFVLNFLGCFMGCLAVGWFIVYGSWADLGIAEGLSLLVGFYGVTCYLPMMLVQRLKLGLKA